MGEKKIELTQEELDRIVRTAVDEALKARSGSALGNEDGNHFPHDQAGLDPTRFAEIQNIRITSKRFGRSRPPSFVVLGELRNVSELTLSRCTLVARGLDARGQPIFERSEEVLGPAVLDLSRAGMRRIIDQLSNPSASAPLKPGHVRPFCMVLGEASSLHVLHAVDTVSDAYRA